MNATFDVTDISLDGFQVVRSQYFSRLIEPAMTLWLTGIAFNVAAYSALNNCETVQILVNNKDKSILIKPVSSRDDDAVNWIKTPQKPASKKIESSIFGKQIYKSWGLDEKRRYRANGRLVQCDKKLMLLFCFSSCEAWEGTKMVKENG